MTTKQVTIENRKGRLKLNDGVYKESADKLIKELETLYGPAAVAAHAMIGEVMCTAEDALEAVDVEINSPGGSVLEGQRIYHALRGMAKRGVEVTTTVNGLAASMGSVILMAGDKRRMTKGSRVMIHEASTMAWGDARTMRKNADLLDGISAEIAGIYAERTGGDPEAIREKMLAETWMTAAQAEDAGFIHEVLKDGIEPDPDAVVPDAVDIRHDEGTEMAMNLIERLKGLVGSDESAVSELDAIIVENTDLQKSLNDRDARITILEAAEIAKDEQIAEHVATITARDETIAELTTDLSKSIEDLDSTKAELAETAGKLEEARNRAHAEAVETLAAIGQTEPLQIEGNGDVSETPHLDRFNQLKGMEATAYYREHKKTINAEARKAKKLG